MKDEIITILKRYGGQATFKTLEGTVSGFADDTWQAKAGLRRNTIRAINNKSPVIVWEGLTIDAVEALLALTAEGEISYKLCSSKLYKHHKLPYTIIRRLTDVKVDLPKLHWLPSLIYLRNYTRTLPDKDTPIDKIQYGAIELCFYKNREWPALVHKDKLSSTITSAINNNMVYDIHSNREVELKPDEINFLKGVEIQAHHWEDYHEQT